MKYTEPTISYQLFDENIVTESPSSVAAATAELQSKYPGITVDGKTVAENW